MSSEFKLKSIVRSNIWNLQPYSSARSEFDLYGSGKNNLTLLDANENPKGDLNRYPDPMQSLIKEELAKQKNLPANQIFVGNGSDEAIDLLYRIFCEPGKDRVITCPPTYGMYEVSAAINNIEVVKIDLGKSFELDLDGIMKSAAFTNAKLLWICSPNNPTGNALLKADLKHDWQAQNYTRGGMMDMPFAPEFEAEMLNNQRKLDQLFGAFKGIVVVDEAYHDFTEHISFINRLEDYPNLVVLQTMSKAYGLAGARVGFAFASPEIIELFNRTKPPYNVNELSQRAVLEALLQTEKTENEIKEIVINREFLAAHLNSFDFIKKVYPSEANFLLAQVDQATDVYNYLRDNGVIIRNRSSQIADTLRFTVGTRRECEEVIKTLRTFKKN
jgi:histidinol-phosphate aminotransferase